MSRWSKEIQISYGEESQNREDCWCEAEEIALFQGGDGIKEQGRREVSEGD